MFSSSSLPEILLLQKQLKMIPVTSCPCVGHSKRIVKFSITHKGILTFRGTTSFSLCNKLLSLHTCPCLFLPDQFTCFWSGRLSLATRCRKTYYDTVFSHQPFNPNTAADMCSTASPPHPIWHTLIPPTLFWTQLFIYWNSTIYHSHDKNKNILMDKLKNVYNW